MSDLGYDDKAELEQYLGWNFRMLMSDFERRCLDLAIKREKATASDAAADKLPRWLADEDESVVQASVVGLDVIRAQISERIDQELKDGMLAINRCPQCNRIVRTPLARQCLWCGYDWHAT